MTDGERIRAALAHGHRFAAERHECPKCEALADLDALLSRLRDAERERDNLAESNAALTRSAIANRDGRKAAEERVRQLEAALRELRDEVARNHHTADEQQTTMPSYSEFWRGREGAMVDVGVWLDAALAAVGPADRRNDSKLGPPTLGDHEDAERREAAYGPADRNEAT